MDSNPPSEIDVLAQRIEHIISQYEEALGEYEESSNPIPSYAEDADPSDLFS